MLNAWRLKSRCPHAPARSPNKALNETPANHNDRTCPDSGDLLRLSAIVERRRQLRAEEEITQAWKTEAGRRRCSRLFKVFARDQTASGSLQDLPQSAHIQLAKGPRLSRHCRLSGSRCLRAVPSPAILQRRPARYLYRLPYKGFSAR